MEKRGPQVNHLSFADDVSGRSKSLELIMKVLSTYKVISSQLVNKSKSYFIIPPNAFKTTGNRVHNVMSFV